MNSNFWSSGYAAIIVGCGGYFRQLTIVIIRTKYIAKAQRNYLPLHKHLQATSIDPTLPHLLSTINVINSAPTSTTL